MAARQLRWVLEEVALDGMAAQEVTDILAEEEEVPHHIVSLVMVETEEVRVLYYDTKLPLIPPSYCIIRPQATHCQVIQLPSVYG
jgi:hypothetical protein